MDEQALRLLLKEHYDGLLSQITTCFADLGFIYAAKSSGACEKRRVVEETTFHEANKLDLGFDSGDDSVMERIKNDRDQKAIDHQVPIKPIAEGGFNQTHSIMSTFSINNFSTSNTNPNKSAEIVHPSSVGVSSLCFRPKANPLIATSWDNQIRCWEVTKNGTSVSSVARKSIAHDQPILSSAWKDDGLTVFSGGCDKQVKIWDPGIKIVFRQHLEDNVVSEGVGSELASRLKGCPIPILSARINGDDVLYHQEACDGLDHQDACDGIYRQNGGGGLYQQDLVDGTVFLDFDPEDSLELRIFGSSWHLFCDPL
ncbi:RAE1-like protein [Tanacetum coccineum]|uniref:RAE1-like protein n=1 Tax=Tanacetum coccineum TaxID=301880 RepID=A0ABQ5DHM4_9ASTR